MKVFAHRGLSSLFPENTIEAFKEALKYKIDGIETDIQLTKDGKMVIFHDETLERTTNGKGFLKDYTLEELKDLNANNHMEGVYKIPTLTELLDLLKDYPDLTINLELKTSVFEYPGIEEKVYDEVKKFGLQKQIIISSFNHYSLLRFQKIDPSIRLGVLTADRFIDILGYMKKYGFNCYHPFFPLAEKEYVEACHNENIEVNVWTVDQDYVYELLKQNGVDTIMTNCCDKFCQLRWK